MTLRRAASSRGGSARPTLFAAAVFATAIALALAPARAGIPGTVPWTVAATPFALRTPAPGLKKLKHLIFILQENRSFDHYFGTFPGADGFPSPLPCLPSTWYPSQCFTPYLNHADVNHGGRHQHRYQVANIDGGKMDGFIESREGELQALGCPPPQMRSAGFHAREARVDDEGVIEDAANCPAVDVMGYHDGTDVPNYWAYAQNFTLLDNFHEAISSWSQPAHFMIFSGWSAKCPKLNPPDIQSCISDWTGYDWYNHTGPTNLWTDITYLLWQHDVSWAAYLDGGIGSPNGIHGVMTSWNTLPGFQTVQEDGQLANSETNLTQFFTDAAGGTLPAVSWIMPEYPDSEHPTASVARGQSYVTRVINALMVSPDWSSSAIFLSWDDPDGFYDHVPPPYVDAQGLGLRLPSIVLGPYAKRGFIDHQLCSTDCYLKFIEDVFLNGERMNQAGRPDPRPDYRDVEATGDLARDFDFGRTPQPPLVLSTHPMSLLRPDGAESPRAAGARNAAPAPRR